ncbi:MAG TPA: DUF1385 domain-containing protein [Anaerolineales bacterium]|nr:DUF1385 domain-containing protein [Anaerolineales bacterium]
MSRPAEHQPPAAQPLYGGQAVLEGVMMRGRSAAATAVRAPDHSIRLDVHTFETSARRRAARWPLVRGIFVLIDTLQLGLRSLSFSASVQAGSGQEDLQASLAASMVLGIVVGLGLFFLLPAAAAFAVERLLSLPAAAGALLEGLLRLGLLLGYLGIIGRVPEIRRVYAYHAAEHKTIHAFEARRPLRVEEVEHFPSEHPRCGTAFLLTIVVLSILVFAVIGPLPIGWRLFSRLLAVPILAGLAYEYIRWSAGVVDRAWAKPLVLPNLALQRLTTRPPDGEMIEVAIAAFEAMRQAETEPRAG